MKKWLIILIVLAVLYGVSSAASKFFETQGDQIAVIPITGTIVSTSTSSLPLQQGSVTSTEIIDFLKDAEKKDSVKAIILEINSPGGTVVATREIAAYVKTIEKPIIAVIREVGASGGYWIASATDKIIADPLSITGSIGVIASYLEFSELLEKFGVSYEGLKAGELKDIGSPFRKMTSEERTIFQKKLDLIHEYFIAEVAENRQLSKQQVKNVATGVYFLGKEAKDLGLVDELGTREDAIAEAKNMAGIEDAEIVEYEKESSLLDLVTGIRTESFFSIGRGIAAELKGSEGLQIRT